MLLSLTPCMHRLAQVPVCMSVLFLIGQTASAGDVLASKAGNTLWIQGGDFSNSVSLIGSETEDGTIGVYLNGSDSPQVFNDVFNILAELGGGDDVIAMDRIRINGNITVEADDGNNTVYLGGWGYGPSDIGGGVSVSAAGGHDAVYIAGTAVSGNVEVELGTGNNIIELGYPVGPGIDPGINDFFSDLTILTGSGHDVIHIVETAVSGQGFIETAAGDDDIRLGPVQVAMSESKDRLQASGDFKTKEPDPDGGDGREDGDLGLKSREPRPVRTTNGFTELTILSGNGHDFVGLEETVVSGAALIQLWYGDDDLYLVDNNDFYGTLTAQGGPGTDLLVDSPTNHYSNAPTFMGFE